MGPGATVVALAVALFGCGGAESASGQEEAGTNARTDARTLAPAVVVRTDRARYAADVRPVVIIRNGLRQAIVTTTGRTDCTIVAFDRLRGTVWSELRNCYSGEPPRNVRIAAGATVRVRLIEKLKAGTYRARLEYSSSRGRARALSAPVRVA